ncbi:MAG: GIY-YIG nuclease family protein [Micavibrio sp.]|nr:GIY-YIG nuclease family protein [Micavibrio sp.]
MDKNYYVYMMTNNHNNVLYTGMTNDLERRVYEHKEGLVKGFTQKYNCKKLVYFEQYNDAEKAIVREKEIKGWVRAKKNALVEATNPHWLDLTETNYQMAGDPSSQAPQDDSFCHSEQSEESLLR